MQKEEANLPSGVWEMEQRKYLLDSCDLSCYHSIYMQTCGGGQPDWQEDSPIIQVLGDETASKLTTRIAEYWFQTNKHK